MSDLKSLAYRIKHTNATIQSLKGHLEAAERSFYAYNEEYNNALADMTPQDRVFWLKELEKDAEAT